MAFYIDKTRKEAMQEKRVIAQQSSFFALCPTMTIQDYFRTNRLREIKDVGGGNETENYEGDYEILSHYNGVERATTSEI